MNDKKPYLFYYEEGIGAWTPVTDATEGVIYADNLEDGEELSIRFKRIDMTDEEYRNIPEE